MGKYHKRIQVEGSDEFELAVNITGKGAPTEDTEAEPGMVYMDEDSENGDLYKCISRTETEEKVVYTWKKMPSQEEVDSLSKAIGDKLDADKLTEAINTALAQAKESGEFDGAPGTPGQPGANGITPHIGTNGNWYIGDTDTGVQAQGEPGEPGQPGADYVLTEDDKNEIAEIAAELVDVPEGGGTSSGDENAVKHHFFNATLEENVDSFRIPLPCGADKLIIFSLVITIPSYDGNTVTTFPLYLRPGAGGNFNMESVPAAGSIQLTGFVFGDNKCRIAKSDRTDGYFEHTQPLINGTGVSNWLGGGEYIDVTKPGNTDFVYPAGTKYWFRGLYR